uniref:Zinc-binding protein A33-like n=1 Tax=Lepisosteus oculatus TaxID=7918 RepID=W5NEU2_LEPOC|nr:PREDICTED: zinc-binding protein A33-like [Lepisosteus oculatus]
MDCSEDQMEKLRRDLSCPVCSDLLKAPVLLECGHHFCRECIRSRWEGPEESARCPLCGRTAAHKVAQDAPLLGSIVGRVRELAAKRDAAAKRKRESYCALHDERLELFCQEDGEAICFVCACSQRHRSHAKTALDCALRQYTEKAQALWQLLQTELKEAVQCQCDTEQRIASLQEDQRLIREKMDAEFAQIRRLLDQEEEALRARLREDEELKRSELERSRVQAQQEVMRLEEAARDVQGKRALCDSPAAVKEVKALLNRNDWTFKKPLNSSLGLLAEEHVGPLQYKVWMRVKELISPGLHPVTLDPDTAHPCLLLSDGNTSVRSAGVKTDVPAHPDRCEHYLDVLGSQGFDSGRHYWEVWVDGKTQWELGVIGASVDRKGLYKTALPRKVWTLRWNSGSYEACNQTVVQLCVKTRLCKVGVYLDYDEGKLVFYNAEGMTLLYAFSNHFQETIYPLFNPGFTEHLETTKPLKIINPQF